MAVPSSAPVPDAASLLRDPALGFEFHRSAGPGGQNVNKVATAVRARFDIDRSSLLSQEVKSRLARLAGGRLTAVGVLIIEAQRYRTQEQNRQDAVRRLAALIQQASRTPLRRRPTKPTRAAGERRLEGKRRRSLTKQRRRGVRGLGQ